MPRKNVRHIKEEPINKNMMLPNLNVRMLDILTSFV